MRPCWFEFPSVLWHCWLRDRKGIRPLKNCATCPQRFYSETGEERNRGATR